MNRRRHPFLLAAAVGGVLLAAWWWCRTTGPTYQGRDVREWLLFRENESFVSYGHDAVRAVVRPDVLVALRAMGTNAVRPLVEVALASNHQSGRGRIFYWLCEKAPVAATKIPFGVRRWMTSGDIQPIARNALFRLRPPASLLIPLITNRLAGADSNEAMRLLLAVGDDREAVAKVLAPFLSKDLEPTADVMRKLGPAAAVALPQLIGVLRTVEGDAANQIGFCLGAIGPAASNALPVLRAAYEKETDRYLRRLMAMNALQMGAPEYWAADEMRSALRGIDRRLQGEAVYALGVWTNVAPFFETELTDLACRDESDSGAIDALYRANFNRARLIPLLTDRLQSKVFHVRTRAAEMLLELDPNHMGAFNCLTKALADPADRPFDKPESLVLCLARLVPLNPHAEGALRQLKISAADVADAEARVAKARADAIWLEEERL